MLIYLFILLHVFIFFEWITKNNPVIKTIVRATLFTILLFVIGLRDGTGADWESYLKLYQAISEAKPVSIETGYLFLNYFFPNIYWVNFFCTLLSLFFLFSSMRNAGIANFSLYLCCFYLPFILLFTGFTRQAVSVSAFSFFWSAIICCKKLSLVPLVIGVNFHYSLLLPAGITLFFKPNKIVKLGLACSVLLLCIFYYEIFFSKISSYILANKYASSGVYLRLIFLIFPCAIFLAQKKRAYPLIIISLFIFSPFFSTLIDRLSYYVIFSLPLLLYSPTLRFKVPVYLTAYICSSCVFTVWYAYSDYAITSWHNYLIAW